MISGECIICFAPDPWGDIWRNRHRLLGILARTNRVLYVEPRMSLRPLARKLRSGEVKLRHFLRPRLEEVREGLHVYHDPLHLPRTGLRGAGAIIERSRDAMLRRALRNLEFSRPILWLVRPDASDIPGKLGEKMVIYQIVDDYLSYPGVTDRARARLERAERQIAGGADLIIVTSEHLLHLKRHLHPNVVLVRNGVDERTLDEGARPAGPIPELLLAARKPIYGYVGGITEKLDLVLLEAVAERLGETGEGSLVLVGPVNVSSAEASTRLEKLRKSPHVMFTGPRPGEEVPSYIRAFDVCLIPYKAGDQSRAIDPLKLYEYLAFGKPTVSVEIPSVLHYEGPVRIARSAEEFLRLLPEAAKERDEALAASRRAIAAQNRWEDRVERISSAIEACLESKKTARAGH